MPLLKIILKLYDEYLTQSIQKLTQSVQGNDNKQQNDANSICVSVSSNAFAVRTSPSHTNPRESRRTSITSKTSILCSTMLNNKGNKDECNLKVFDIKLIIAKELEIRPDILNLYTTDKEGNITQLNDNDNYIIDQCINNSILKDNKSRRASTGTFLSLNQNEFMHVLYYKISSEKHKVIVNVFHNKINKIIFYLSPYCSIYMLKYYITQRLSLKNNNNMDYLNINNTLLYANGFEEKEYDIFNLANTSILFKDSFLINDIINHYIDKAMQENTSLSFSALANPKTLNLLLFIKTQSKASIGLDFSFNTFKSFNKITFDENAPSFREACDGLNYIMYCSNKSCSIYNDYFLYHKGYGLFNILECINGIECPKCKKKNNVLRSIGMINSKWSYKGLLNQKNQSKCEGDGNTFENNKLFVIPEINFSQQYLSLLIQVKLFKNKEKCLEKRNSSSLMNSSQMVFPDEDKSQNGDDSQRFSESELDNINLYDINNNDNNDNNLTKKTNNITQNVKTVSNINSEISSQHSELILHNKRRAGYEIVIVNLNECKNKKLMLMDSQSTLFHLGSSVRNKEDNIIIEKKTVACCNSCSFEQNDKLKTCIVF